MAKAKGARQQDSGSRRWGPLLLGIAWLLLVLGIAGVGVWNNYLAPPPEGPAPEPFFVGLEPEPEPEPPPQQTANTDQPMPALPDSTEVPQVEPAPPGAAPGAPPSMAPGTRPAAPPRTTNPAPSSPSGANPSGVNPNAPGAAGAPADQQMAAVAPRPAAPTAPAIPAIWQQFARPFDVNDTRPRIAIVILDLGLSSAATAAAVQNLPGPVTLSFSPYAESLESWINLARAAGHEALLGLPMEPANFPTKDPGPRTLLTSLSPKQNIERMDWVLNRVSGYVGVTNNMGSRFTTSADALRPVLTNLRDRGLVFVDARTTPRSVAAGIATQLNLPRAINDRLIDQEAARASIDAVLADLERVARETGNAVGMGQPFPVTFERLNAWLPTLEGKGIALAPITAVLNRQPDR